MPSSPAAMNSLHPSTAYPPMLAAWFLRHSLYLTVTFSFFAPLEVEDFIGPLWAEVWCGLGVGFDDDDDDDLLVK